MIMRATIACVGLLCLSTPVAAQERPADEGWRVYVGAGGLYAPAYEGDDDYRLSALPSIRVEYGDRFSTSVENGARYQLLDGANLRAGPIARLKFPRDEDGGQTFAITGDDSDDLVGLGDVDASVELGGFVEYDLGALTLTAEARQAVSGHEGLVADLGAQWSGRAEAFGAPMRWSIGPRARFVDDDYVDAYFGVDAGQSLASGLPIYAPRGGLYSYGVGASSLIPLTRDGQWSAIVFAGYDKLAGDAAESPLVRLRGSEDQASVGVFLSYRLY
jgi:outer membrane protein